MTTRWPTSGSASSSSPTPTTRSRRRGYLDNTVLMVTFDEWGGFFDHVPPPHVIDDTNPADVDHTGDGTTPTDGQLMPDYTQLGFRVRRSSSPTSRRPQIVHHGPYEHASTLALIESTFGLNSLTARDANASNLGEVLHRHPHHGRGPAGSRPAARCPAPATTRPRSAARTACSRSRRRRSGSASGRRKPCSSASRATRPVRAWPVSAGPTATTSASTTRGGGRPAATSRRPWLVRTPGCGEQRPVTLHIRVISPPGAAGALVTAITASPGRGPARGAAGAHRPEGDAVQFDVTSSAANAVFARLRDLDPG